MTNILGIPLVHCTCGCLYNGDTNVFCPQCKLFPEESKEVEDLKYKEQDELDAEYENNALLVQPVFVEEDGEAKVYLQTAPYVDCNGQVVVKRLATIDNVKIIDVERQNSMRKDLETWLKMTTEGR